MENIFMPMTIFREVSKLVKLGEVLNWPLEIQNVSEKFEYLVEKLCINLAGNLTQVQFACLVSQHF